jgi:SAM-dependent methyltransferase
MLTEVHTASPALASFRDPGGRLYRFPERILRAVEPSHVDHLNQFLNTRTAQEATARGQLVRSSPVSPRELMELERDLALPETEAGSLWLEHERIPFASFPYEWPAEMLHAAASLTLDLAEAALDEGFGLKDATPYNVLFRGGQAVFVDVLSFERRDPLDSTWLAYGQFVRTFLLPLAAQRYFGLSVDEVLRGQRDGVEPETMYAWANWRRRLTPPLLGLVSIPTWCSDRPKWLSGSRKETGLSYRSKPSASAEQARFVLGGLLRSCRRQLKALAPKEHTESTWSGYLDHKSLYTPAQLEQKERFVSQALDSLVQGRPTRVLDIGANEGRFSFLAARRGAEVVAIDSDPTVVGSIWRRALGETSAGHLNVLPLVVDFTRPTPAVGWRNQECPSFLDRAEKKFDLVMFLAVAHHILVTERIPLEDLLALADELSRDYVLIEFVAPADPMFQRIVRGRDELYSHFSPAWFEAAAMARFELVRSERLNGLHRWLYLFRRRRATS